MSSVTALDHRQQSEPAATEDYMSAMQRLGYCGLGAFVLVFVCIAIMSILQLVQTDWCMTQHLICMFMDFLKLSAL